MNVTEFGTALVQRGDLDPIYLMLNAAGLDPAVLQRWSLAYWMFYHAGVASRIADAGSDQRFWDAVWQAQEEKWPRGTERRHFKGEQSRKAIAELEGRYPHPENAAMWAATGYTANEVCAKKRLGTLLTPVRFTAVRERAMRWRGFGPWIAFKVADMCDAVLGVPVDFADATPYLFDDPVKGAVWVAVEAMLPGTESSAANPLDPHMELLKRTHDGLSADERRGLVMPVVDYLGRQLGHLPAPHAPGRTLKLQEYETILCKYKSHLNGHYPVGKDTKEIIHGLGDPRWGQLAGYLRDTLAATTEPLP